MTETKWTPGPWTTDESEHDAPHENIKIRGSKYHTICTVWIDDACHDRNGEQTANANLIVASPDLYAALDFVKFIEEKGYDEKNAYVDLEDDDECICLTFRQFREIMLARRKARGE